MFSPEMLILGAVFGFIYGFLLQKADFCFVASFRDWISVKDSRLGVGVTVLVLTSIIGYGLLLSIGVVGTSDLWTLPLGVSNLIGGILFGLGAAIAGSCASGTLYRSGMGYVQFWIVLVSMMAGNLLFALVYDPYMIDYFFEPLLFADSYTLFSLPVPPLLISLLITLLVVYPVWKRFGFSGIWEGAKTAAADLKGNPFTNAHWDARLVAFLMGVTALIQFLTISVISITGPETRLAGWLWMKLGGEEAVLQNVYLNVMFASYPDFVPGPQEVLVLSIIAGSFVASLLSGSFRLRFPRWSRLPYAVGGGLLMGVASRMAPGCNIANIVGGVGALSIHSIMAVMGMAVGVYFATRYIFKMPLLLFQKSDGDFGV